MPKGHIYAPRVFFTLDLKVLDATYVGAQHMHLPWTAGVRSAKVNPAENSLRSNSSARRPASSSTIVRMFPTPLNL
ncbi:hypothetical protein NL676_028519 [Syzygium grande]|nr:hypothetical protein NL676_028519 [Syzygium grande]